MMDETAVSGEGGAEAPAPQVPPARKAGETPKQQIRKAKHITRRHFTAEDKIRIVMEGIRGEESVSEICRREHYRKVVGPREAARAGTPEV